MKKKKYRVRVSVTHIVDVHASSAQAAEDKAQHMVADYVSDMETDHIYVTNVTMLPTEKVG